MMMTLPTPYWQSDDGRATLYCGDNASILPALGSGSVDLVVTSPPYDDLRTYGGCEWNFACVANNLTRLLNSGGVIVWVVGDATIEGSESGTSMRQALHFMEVCGLRLHDTMIYHKAGTGMAGSLACYIQAFEFMFVISKGAPKTFNVLRDRRNVRGGTINRNPARRSENGQMKPNRDWNVPEFGRRLNVWQYGHAGVDLGHPAPFPLPLARDHVLSWSNHNDIILDPFAGSGTTGVACIQTGRKFIGIELSEKYCAIAARRLAAACCEDGGLFDPKAKHRASLFSEAV